MGDGDPIIMDASGEAHPVRGRHAPRAEMLTAVRSLNADEMRVFLADDEVEGKRAMFAVQSLCKRDAPKHYHVFYRHPKLYVVRTA